MRTKCVVVTGVSYGLGRALVLELTRLGHRVVGCGRSNDAVERLAVELGEAADVSRLDVTSDSVDSWAQGAVERHGAPDLVINNAALANVPAPLWRVEPEEFDAVMAVNVGGTYRVLRAFLPSMIARGTGVVANFSSGWGRSTSPEVAPYCASKWAVEGLTRALAQELPTGLAAVAVNPGIIRTQMLERVFGGSASSFEAPDAWAARAVPFLLGLGPEDNGRSLDVG